MKSSPARTALAPRSDLASRSKAGRVMLPLRSLRAVLLGICLTSGCGSAVTEEDSADHHTHTHMPRHRPRDFEAAVKQLHRRWPLDRSVDAASGNAAPRTLLGDIIRWLPEIAGESDLGRPEWDEVHRMSLELEAIFKREESTGQTLVEDESRRKTLFAQLDRIVPLTTDSLHGRRPSDRAPSPAPADATTP